MKEFPAVLTTEEFDFFGFDFEKQFGLNDDRHNSFISADVSKYAKENSCQIYSQVDPDEGPDCVYARGLRFVNRVGIYWAVRKDGYKIDNS